MHDLARYRSYRRTGFPDDVSELQLVQQANRVKLAMAEGRTIGPERILIFDESQGPKPSRRRACKEMTNREAT